MAGSQLPLLVVLQGLMMTALDAAPALAPTLASAGRIAFVRYVGLDGGENRWALARQSTVS